MTDPRILPAAKALYAHPISNGSGKTAPEIIAQCESAAVAMLSAIDHATTITTEEGLDALPDETVLRDKWGNVNVLAIYELGSTEPTRTWHQIDGTEHLSVALPARIIERG